MAYDVHGVVVAHAPPDGQGMGRLSRGANWLPWTDRFIEDAGTVRLLVQHVELEARPFERPKLLLSTAMFCTSHGLAALGWTFGPAVPLPGCHRLSWLRPMSQTLLLSRSLFATVMLPESMAV